MQRWFLPRRRRRWQRCAPLLFGPSSTFAVWRLGESHSVSVRGAGTLPLLASEQNSGSSTLFFSFFFLALKLWYHHCFFFLSSVKKISGQTKKDERIYPENFTRILDRLLDGYDNRLRPGFGGMYEINAGFFCALLPIFCVKTTNFNHTTGVKYFTYSNSSRKDATLSFNLLLGGQGRLKHIIRHFKAAVHSLLSTKYTLYVKSVTSIMIMYHLSIQQRKDLTSLFIWALMP